MTDGRKMYHYCREIVDGVIIYDNGNVCGPGESKPIIIFTPAELAARDREQRREGFEGARLRADGTISFFSGTAVGTLYQHQAFKNFEEQRKK